MPRKSTPGKPTEQAARGAVSSLLGLLVDDEVIAILKSRLSPEQVADLVMSEINPYRRLSTAQKAKLGDCTERTILDREKRGE